MILPINKLLLMALMLGLSFVIGYQIGYNNAPQIAPPVQLVLPPTLIQNEYKRL
jgi:hypothetical protein